MHAKYVPFLCFTDDGGCGEAEECGLQLSVSTIKQFCDYYSVTFMYAILRSVLFTT
jgi:hypothetical protein